MDTHLQVGPEDLRHMGLGEALAILPYGRQIGSASFGTTAI